jgi:Cd2+/Zn2+-exporting ATPase
VAWISRVLPAGEAGGVVEYVYTAGMVGAAVVSGEALARRAWASLRMRSPGIEVLVTVAAAGAVAIGEYWEAAAVTFLFDLGGYLEWKTLERTRAAIRALADWSPQTARVRRADGSEEVVHAGDVRPGDILVVKSGDKLAADGIIIRGEAEVNEAALTGEPLPVPKGPGDKVMAGSVATLGLLEVQATRVGEETTFGRIIQMVGEAQEARTPVQTLVERFAKYYTPAIMVLAAITFMITRDTRLALTLLVVACPGALVLAAPVSLVAGIGRAARQGVLIKGGQRLEKLARVNAVAFDKTGTLTAGRPEVVSVQVLGNPGSASGSGSGSTDVAITGTELLRLAAAAEKGSEHPLAAAILERATAELQTARSSQNRQHLHPFPAEPLPEPQEVKVFPGRGIAADVGGRQVLVGNTRLMEEMELTVDASVLNSVQEEAARGRTVALVAVDGRVCGWISLADRIRESARNLVPLLHRAGVRQTVMLTGDSAAAAAPVAATLGVDRVEAGLLPEDKVKKLRELSAQGFTVAMVGDGINDAPALSAADVSIAIGAGTDVALEAADVALITDNLEKIPFAIGLARAIVANVRQNLTFAVAVVLTLVAGVLFGRVHLASGMLVHEISVLAVILNGMRLLYLPSPRSPSPLRTAR